MSQHVGARSVQHGASLGHACPACITKHHRHVVAHHDELEHSAACTVSKEGLSVTHMQAEAQLAMHASTYLDCSAPAAFALTVRLGTPGGKGLSITHMQAGSAANTL